MFLFLANVYLLETIAPRIAQVKFCEGLVLLSSITELLNCLYTTTWQEELARRCVGLFWRLSETITQVWTSVIYRGNGKRNWNLKTEK